MKKKLVTDCAGATKQAHVAIRMAKLVFVMFIPVILNLFRRKNCNSNGTRLSEGHVRRKDTSLLSVDTANAKDRRRDARSFSTDPERSDQESGGTTAESRNISVR